MISQKCWKTLTGKLFGPRFLSFPIRNRATLISFFQKGSISLWFSPLLSIWQIFFNISSTVVSLWGVSMHCSLWLKLVAPAFIFFGKSVRLPSSSLISLILLYFHLRRVVNLKNMVFLSYSFSHIILDFWLQWVSSWARIIWYSISSDLSFSNISKLLLWA